MMIMAQHPQRQPQSQAQHVGPHSRQQQQQPAINKQTFHTPKHKITTSDAAAAAAAAASINGQSEALLNKNPQINLQDQQQQQQLQQDGKRSLIKNQLYLIEQLQLENADLRNERDQLQLENEELKFQLQMISSSNILSQSGGTFNNQALVGESASKAAAAGPLDSDAPVRKTMATNGSADQAAKILLAAPLRDQPAKLGGAARHHHQVAAMAPPDDDDDASNGATSASNLLVRSFTKCSGLQSGSDNLKSSLLSAEAKASDGKTIKSTTNSNSSHHKSLGCKSTSLNSINVKTATVSLAKRSNAAGQHHDADDDDDYSQRLEFAQRIYGDSEKVQAAAIVIQRAFRKYQICKRFRTITEQLRHARHLNGGQQQQHHQQSERRSEPSSPTASARAGRSAAATAELTFASGATRAAAWESLSYAASRLAAAAAAAAASSSNKFQSSTTTSNETSNHHHHQQQQQQQQKSPSSRHRSSAEKAARNQPPQQPVESRNSAAATAAAAAKADPVVAAAINFQQLESIRKRQYRVGLNIFNKSPEKGVSFLIAHSFIDASQPLAKNSSSYYHSNQLHFIDKQHVLHERTVASIRDSQTGNGISCQMCIEEENLKRNVAHFLLHRKGLAKEKIGQYLGNLQAHFNQEVLKYYLQELDFTGLQIDLALRKFLSTFRLPGEAQKIERIVDCFAQRYAQCQQLQLLTTNMTSIANMAQLQFIRDPSQHPQKQQQQQPLAAGQPAAMQQQIQCKNNTNLMLLSKDEIFILTFAIIMLNTDLHSPSLKPTSRMSSRQFVNNLRGVFKSNCINESDLLEIYDRVKANQITTTPDHVSHVMKVQQGLTVNNFQKKELPNLCVPHRRLVCFCRLFEVYDVTKKERVGQHQREIFLFNDLLLVTKLARRVRANSSQLYTYRQSIPLQGGLYVSLFQSQHYTFGIRLCRKSDDESLIMFNARNEHDQSRFVDDLSESIAEMNEMETIKAHNLIETIHFRQQERLRRHGMLHAISESSEENVHPIKEGKLVEKCDNLDYKLIDSARAEMVDRLPEGSPERKKSNNELELPNRRPQREGKLRGKFSSMLNLSNCEDDENRTQPKVLRLNQSFAQHQQQPQSSDQPRGSHNDSGSSGQRRCSTSSVHSLDSGLFLSRDISPNQSS